MAKLFLNMMIEEWRVHSTMFGSLNFALFPVMILGIAFMGTFLLPLISAAIPIRDLVIIVHANYLMLGIMVGGFGLLGNEVMNRRFGQASLLAFSARILPLSQKYIFTIFVLKDTLYYFFLWVFPLAAGFFIGSVFTGIPTEIPVRLMITLTLSFMSGLSLVFLLTSGYSRSPWLLSLMLIAIVGFVLLTVQYTGLNPALVFPPLLLFYRFTIETGLVAFLAVLIPFSIALIISSPDEPSRVREYRSRMHPLISHLFFLPTPPLAAKDLIDLWRSGSILGQTIFSFLVPLIVIWFFLSLLEEYVSVVQLLLTYAMITGIIASTMYTWLTMFDTYGTYAILPVSIRTLITSKIMSFTLMQAIPVVFIGTITHLSGEGSSILPVLVLMISISYYTLSVTIWLTGLSPSVLVYSARVMVIYFLLIGIVLTLFSSVTSVSPWYAISAVFLFIPSYLFIRQGFRRWDRVDQPLF